MTTLTARPLTAREREVAALVAKGLTNKAIAGELGGSVRTVEAHMRNIFMKLRAESRIEVALRVIQGGAQ